MREFRTRHEAIEPISRPRRMSRRLRMSEILLALMALAAANAVASFLTGPELYGPPGAMDTLAARTAFPTPEDEARARAVEDFRRIIVYVAMNTITVSTLVYLLIARRLERARRARLGLPEGLDESLIAPDLEGPSGRPRSASDYRPSVN